MSDQCVGEIRMFAGNFAPEGWLLCNGQQLSVTNYELLFSLIGNAYGGDGRTTFALPDLRSRIPLSQGKAPSGTQYTLAQKGGAEAINLSIAQAPAHSHSLVASSNAATVASPQGNFLAVSVNSEESSTGNTDAWYIPKTGPESETFSLNPQAVQVAGGSQAHANIMPCNPVNFIIAWQGVYPEFQS